jgi:hypothetical protein
VSATAYWAATRSEAQREKVAQLFLEQAGYEVYLPKIRHRRHRKGRRIEVLSPIPRLPVHRIEWALPNW